METIKIESAVSNQLKEIKMLNFYKETVKTNVKEVTVDQFIKAINGE